MWRREAHTSGLVCSPSRLPSPSGLGAEHNARMICLGDKTARRRRRNGALRERQRYEGRGELEPSIHVKASLLQLHYWRRRFRPRRIWWRSGETRNTARLSSVEKICTALAFLTNEQKGLEQSVARVRTSSGQDTRISSHWRGPENRTN